MRHCLLLFFALIVIVSSCQEVSGLQCKLCIGSPNSDCASDEESAMVIQDCPIIELPNFPRRHHRHHFRHPHFETTIRTLNTIDEEPTTPLPYVYERELDNDEEQLTDNANESKLERKKLIPSCVYLQAEASNITTSLVTRGCGYAPPHKDVCKIFEKLNNKIVVCTACTTDKCN